MCGSIVVRVLEPDQGIKVLSPLAPGPEVIKLFSSSAQLSMKFQLLINAEIVKLVENSGS